MWGLRWSLGAPGGNLSWCLIAIGRMIVWVLCGVRFSGVATQHDRGGQPLWVKTHGYNSGRRYATAGPTFDSLARGQSCHLTQVAGERAVIVLCLSLGDTKTAGAFIHQLCNSCRRYATAKCATGHDLDGRWHQMGCWALPMSGTFPSGVSQSHLTGRVVGGL
jgi:hypothetical protein